ncbi:TMEM14 family protein [Aerosakkonemataceae cyanobacterium BLCC-F154]|uniref:TMEM14 family protein n=1 Tax=Floridaenema fluviatile BLCC-F154 TaxID=3153640 RepID=A0ABV4YDT5_9CYAN
MEQILIWAILGYALVVGVGGVFGYLKAKSTKSLLAGLISGLILLVAWFVAIKTPIAGLGVATLMAAVLLVVFITRFFRTRKFMPAGMMMLLNLVAMMVFLAGWLNLV